MNIGMDSQETTEKFLSIKIIEEPKKDDPPPDEVTNNIFRGSAKNHAYFLNIFYQQVFDLSGPSQSLIGHIPLIGIGVSNSDIRECRRKPCYNAFNNQLQHVILVL